MAENGTEDVMYLLTLVGYVVGAVAASAGGIAANHRYNDLYNYLKEMG